MMRDVEMHTKEEKDDVQRAKNKFRMFANLEGETVKIATKDFSNRAKDGGQGLVQAVHDVEVQRREGAVFLARCH